MVVSPRFVLFPWVGQVEAPPPFRCRCSPSLPMAYSASWAGPKHVMCTGVPHTPKPNMLSRHSNGCKTCSGLSKQECSGRGAATSRRPQWCCLRMFHWNSQMLVFLSINPNACIPGRVRQHEGTHGVAPPHLAPHRGGGGGSPAAGEISLRWRGGGGSVAAEKKSRGKLKRAQGRDKIFAEKGEKVCVVFACTWPHRKWLSSRMPVRAGRGVIVTQWVTDNPPPSTSQRWWGSPGQASGS